MAITIPDSQTTGTLITDTLWNQVVGGVAHLLGLKHAGSTLAEAGTAVTIGHPVGQITAITRTSDDGNVWLRLDGRSIGGASSGATARAHADMQTLFTHLWTEFANAQLPIQDSGGGAATRGVSAAADWAANKRLPLPDLRGRIIAGMDDPSGASAANRITNGQADVLGGVYGLEGVTLAIGEIPAHTHPISTYQTGTGTLTTATSAATPGGSNVTGSTGDGGIHLNVQPTLFLNYFIYTGN